MVTKEISNLLFLPVNTRQNNVTWWFPRELYYSLAEISVDHINSLRVQVFIKLALLGKHRLALYHVFDLSVPDYVINYLIVFNSISSPVNHCAISNCIFFK